MGSKGELVRIRLVVGGGEGVGAETAFRLADQGKSSVLVARKTGLLEETAEIADDVLASIGDGPVQFCGGEGNRQGVEFSSGVNHGRLVAGPHKWMKACAGRGN